MDERPPLVFLDEANRPYSIQDVEGEPWLCYWHTNKRWVTLRVVTETEVAQYETVRLPDASARLYEDAHQAKTLVWSKVENTCRGEKNEL